jgi:hypothetical protein
MRSNDFCIPKQEECKGFYDNHQQYQTQCNTLKCNGDLNNQCGLKLCSKTTTDCYNYRTMIDSYLKIRRFSFRVFYTNKEVENKRDSIKSFNRLINNCANKIYQFNSGDFCINNSKNCFEKKKIRKRFGYNYKFTQVDCKCPIEISFKCDKYCTTNSIACDYFKMNENKKKNTTNIISNCKNNNELYLTSNAYLW